MDHTTLIDIEALLAPLGEEAPCGENLEYDARFLQLEQAARGTPDVQYGSTVTPAAPPDWHLVQQLALELSARSRDLRLAVPLARALLGQHGVRGLASGLALLAALLESQWENVHPQLDPDDGMDPVLRINVLAALCEAAGMLRDLRDAPLVAVRALGSFSLRDIEVAAGEAEPLPGKEKVAMSVIEAAFAAARADVGVTHTALAAAAGSVRRIEEVLAQRVGLGSALDFAPLLRLLQRAGNVLRPWTPAPDGDGVQGQSMDGAHAAGALHAADTSGGAGWDAQALPGDGSAGVASGGGQRAPAAPPGSINSRADVVRQIERICDYYAAREPSSPVPLLLQRARSLVDKNFMELMQDLAPDGLAQLHHISGNRQDG